MRKPPPKSSYPEYQCWRNIIGRCYEREGSREWKYYGGLGIEVCERWLNSYDTFLADMGRRPTKKHSIDRINSNGHYEPSNCRWATQEEQMNNLRKKKYPKGIKIAIKAAGSQSALARLLGITPQSIVKWVRVPPKRIIQIEKLTKVPREKLAPWLYKK